jgi:hypothetical protein
VPNKILAGIYNKEERIKEERKRKRGIKKEEVSQMSYIHTFNTGL